MFCIRCMHEEDNKIHWSICSLCHAMLHIYCNENYNHEFLEDAIKLHRDCAGAVDLV